jgi:hypothetical protein
MFSKKSICFTISILLFYTYSKAQYSKEFYAITADESCKKLIDSVAKCWQATKDSTYYHSSFKPTNTNSKYIQLPCITGIKRSDIEILFGKPNSKYLETSIYFTSKTYKKWLPNSFVKMNFKNDRLNSIKETSCPQTNKFLTKNFIYNKKTKKYKLALMPKYFGVDTIKNECLQQLRKEQFIDLFGKPTLKFSKKNNSNTLYKVEYDDKGNEIELIRPDNSISGLRYFSDTIGENKNSGFEIKVMTDGSLASIIIYNCNHSIDTIKKNWQFNSSQNFFNCKLSLTEIDLMSNCLFGMSLENIYELFGKPNQENTGKLEYNTQPLPKGKSDKPSKLIILLNDRKQLEFMYSESSKTVVR